jgi:hypothetical protein
MPPKDFFGLGDAEAEAFFEDYVASATARLEAFRREVAATGGPSERSLDGSPESLIGLWRWFVGRPREDGGELPAWYEPDAPGAPGALAPSTVRDADGLALYLASVFMRELPGFEWGLGKLPRRKKYVSQNKPVLKRGDVDIDTLQVAFVLAQRRELGRDTDDEALLRTYRAWAEPLSST